MSTIIKVSDSSAGPRAPTAAEGRAAAEAYLSRVREQAHAILVEAREQADAIRHAAEEAGRQTAERRSDSRASAALTEQLNTLLPALRRAVEQIEQARAGLLAHWQQQAVRLSCKIAARIVRRELASQPEITANLVAEALELVTAQGGVRVLLCPADVQTLRPHVTRVAAELSRLGTVEIVADPKVTAGGCIVETRYGTIDQRVETQLARIEEELS
jgi:flagellar assembly protein FliH